MNLMNLDLRNAEKGNGDFSLNSASLCSSRSRATLPSLCSNEAEVHENDIMSDFLSGQIAQREKIAVWSSYDKEENVILSASNLRRKLRTPPHIREQIRIIIKAEQERLDAEQSVADSKFGNIFVTSSGNAISNPNSRDGLKSRARSGAASRDIARRIQIERQKMMEESKNTKKQGIRTHPSPSATLGTSASYLNFNRESLEELEQRRATAEKRKQDRGDVIFTRKKPVSPPKSAMQTSSRSGGQYGNMIFQPPDSARAIGQGGPRSSDPPKVINASISTNESSTDGIPPRETTLQERCALNDTILQDEFNKYFGNAAKAGLMLKFKRANQDLETMPNDSDVPPHLRTPRFLYMREVEKSKLIPLSLPVRKKANPRGIFLGGKGLGDTRILPIVLVTDSLPAVESIDVSDNRMTDASLMPLMLKLPTLNTLTFLDLSYNKMDNSSRTIMNYIASNSCTLRTLKLNGADVDDYECCNLCDAMIANRSIETLCLSRNSLGAEEHRRLLKPDLVLAGDGIGKMLLKNKTLTSLDLSWNSLRLAGASTIGRALKKNETLRSLFLQFNTFGDQGTQSIGYALKYNKSLVELDLSNNAIVPRSACVLANSLSHNETLVFLNVNDNILGRVGSQATVAAIQRSQDVKRVITFSGCDCSREDPSLFDPSKPQGKWILDLAEPYGQMIAEECFFLSNYRAGCSIDKLTYEGKEIFLERKSVGAKRFSLGEMQRASKAAAKNIISLNFSAAAIDLAVVLSQFCFKMPSEQALLVVKKVGDNWAQKQKRRDRTEDLHEVFLTEVFFALFIINDVDCSGSMDVDEFISTLISLGLEGCDRVTAMKLMEEHDRDRSGTIDAGEFAMIMVNEFCRTDQPRGTIVEKTTSRPWPIPATGQAVLEVKFIIDSASIFDVGSEDGVETLIQGIVGARTSDQKDILFEQACTSPYFFFTADQAQLLFDEAMGAGLSKLPLDMIISILPQIVNEEQTNKFLDANLNDVGKLALRCKIGPLYNAFVGIPTGHYFIDLSKTLDRMGSKRLAAVSVSEARTARIAGANLSQKGNGTNFRNEIIGQNYFTSTPIAVSGQWFADCPKVGELRLDYVSTKRVLAGTLPLAPKRFQQLVESLDLHSIFKWKPCAEELASEIQVAQEALSIMQTSRSGDAESGMREIMKIHALKVALKEVSDRVYSAPCMKVLPPLNMGAVKEQFHEIMDTCHHFLDILPREAMRDVSRMNYNPDPEYRAPTPEILVSAPPPDKRRMPPIYPYAYRKMLELQIQMPSIFLTCKQAVQLMDFFPEDGYLRIQVLMTVFSRIIDAENICEIYDNHCSPDERAEMMHRLGILCVMDPMKPDREYKLDLRRSDMREWCKILINLALNEPGDNWAGGGEYRWSKYDDPVPGWILPQPWTTPDDADGGEGGPRRYGWLRVTYTSTAKGCEIVPQVRRNMRRRTLSGLKSLL